MLWLERVENLYMLSTTPLLKYLYVLRIQLLAVYVHINKNRNRRPQCNMAVCCKNLMYATFFDDSLSINIIYTNLRTVSKKTSKTFPWYIVQ